MLCVIFLRSCGISFSAPVAAFRGGVEGERQEEHGGSRHPQGNTQEGVVVVRVWLYTLSVCQKIEYPDRNKRAGIFVLLGGDERSGYSFASSHISHVVYVNSVLCCRIVFCFCCSK